MNQSDCNKENSFYFTIQNEYAQQYFELVQSLSRNSAFTQYFQSCLLTNKQNHANNQLSLIPTDNEAKDNFNQMQQIFFKENSSPSVICNDVLIESQTTKVSNTKKPIFFIITERKLKPDAIFKKINKAFYNWIIIQLNKAIKNEFKFIKVSKELIKTIKKSKVSKILKKTLRSILETDQGSEKYKNRKVNKDNLQNLQLITPDYKSLEQFLDMPLYLVYHKFQADDRTNIKGPSYYQTLYKFLKEKYLEIFLNNDEKLLE